MDERSFFKIAKALSDPRRFNVLQEISGRDEISCGGIAELFPISQATVSHHLRVLTEADLVEVRREGQHGYFSARLDVLSEYCREVKKRLQILSII
ncbi:MAG: helix-turn-helix transcriptional regulator [Candidatus Marinimicrobia bacterium]|nr:helix-turn-helix transcriptional regulator [Candidatus Neomarinimicrobiota bacterium]